MEVGEDDRNVDGGEIVRKLEEGGEIVEERGEGAKEWLGCLTHG